MARLSGGQVGFELQTLADGVEIDTTGGSGSSSIVVGNSAGLGNYGVSAVLTSTSGGQDSYVVKQFFNGTINGQTYFQFFLQPDGSYPQIFNTGPFPGETTIIILGNSFSQVSVWVTMDDSGNLRFYDSGFNIIFGSVPTIDLNVYSRIEIAHNASSGVIDLYINGDFVDSAFASLQNLNLWVIGLSASQYFGWSETCTGTIYWDDIIVNDDSDIYENSFPNGQYIFHLQPNAAGDNNQFTVRVGGTAGAANNYTRVSEVTPDDSLSYNGDILVNHIDDFNLVNAPSGMGSSDTINSVSVGVRYTAAVAALEATFVTRIKATSGGTVGESGNIIPISTTWVTNENDIPYGYQLITYTKPGGSVAWIKTDLDASQVGYRISVTGTNAVDITTVWLLASVTPQSGPVGTNHFLTTLGAGS